MIGNMIAEEKAEENYDDIRSDYLASKESEGYKIVLPKRNELQIDVDTEEQFKAFAAMYIRLAKVCDSELSYKDKVSESGGWHRHITVTLPFNVTQTERVALQAILSSDPVRELLSFIRIQRGDKRPTLFLEKD